jgi:hypothetical protein
MQHSLNDKDPGRQKAVTNADEQEVAVNHSTADHGYDEPVASEPTAAAPAESENVAAEELKKERKPGKGRPSQTKNL